MATKIWLIVAAALVVAGGLIFVGVMTVLNWDFTKLTTGKHETNHYTITEAYQNLSVVSDTADILLLPSEDGTGSVVCREQKNLKHTVEVRDGTLVIELVDTRKWYEYIGIISFEKDVVTVYMPQGEYGVLSIQSDTSDVEISKEFGFESMDIRVSTGDVSNRASVSGAVKIKTSTGDIFMENLSADTLDLSVSTGKIAVTDVTCRGGVSIRVSTGDARLTNVTCRDFVSKGNTGNMILKSLIVSEGLSIERSTGDVKFDSCDAAEISVKTDTGNVTGTLLSEKVFLVKTDTGRVSVPESITGGKCTIKTDTGDIRISVVEAE